MATVSITNHLICPTENDINGGTSGAGRIPTEDTLSKLWRNPSGLLGYVDNGFTPPSVGTSNRTQNIASGTAFIDGFCVTGSATTSVQFTASATEYWWLRLLYVSGKVTDREFLSVSSATNYPANSIPLWKVTCNANDVTAVVDHRTFNRRLHGLVDGLTGDILDSGSSRWSVVRNTSTTFTLTFASGFFPRAPLVSIGCLTATNGAAAEATSATNCNVIIGLANADWHFQAFI